MVSGPRGPPTPGRPPPPPPQPKSQESHLVIPGIRLGIALEALWAHVRGHRARELTPETTNKRYVAFPLVFFLLFPTLPPHLALVQFIKPSHPVAPGRARPIASAESARGAQGTCMSKRAWEHVVPEAACPLHPGRGWHPRLRVPRANGETETRAFQPSSFGKNMALERGVWIQIPSLLLPDPLGLLKI